MSGKSILTWQQYEEALAAIKKEPGDVARLLNLTRP